MKKFKYIEEGMKAYHEDYGVNQNPYPEGSVENYDWEFGYIRERAIENWDLCFVKDM